MPYKYEEKILKLNENLGCNCYDDYVEKECEAYRFTFAEITDKRNFLPTASDPTNNKARQKCSGYAISFHETETSSKNTWDYLIDDRPNLFKKIGTHISKGTLTKAYGKCSDSDEHLHFNFAEYEDIKLEAYFQIHQQLASDEMLKKLNV